MKKVFSILATGLFALSLGLTSCGGDGSTNTDATTTDTTATTATPAPVDTTASAVDTMAADTTKH